MKFCSYALLKVIAFIADVTASTTLRAVFQGVIGKTHLQETLLSNRTPVRPCAMLLLQFLQTLAELDIAHYCENTISFGDKSERLEFFNTECQEKAFHGIHISNPPHLTVDVFPSHRKFVSISPNWVKISERISELFDARCNFFFTWGKRKKWFTPTFKYSFISNSDNFRYLSLKRFSGGESLENFQVYTPGTSLILTVSTCTSRQKDHFYHSVRKHFSHKKTP